MKKFTDSKTCLKCAGCCRYHEENSIWQVKGVKLSPNPDPAQSAFICSFLNPQHNKCKVYSSRPFECRLYPFLINKKGERLFLAVDLNCPYAKEKFNSREFKEYVEYLKGALKETEKIAQGYPGVTDILQLNEALLRKVSINDKKIFDKYLKLSRPARPNGRSGGHKQLSAYAFENIYIWKSLFDIYRAIIDENLCVFFKDKTGAFLYLPPLGETTSQKAVSEVFSIMDNINKNKDVSRIENIEKRDIDFYKKLGYECREKSRDYICRQSDLAQLKGNKFKAKRKSVNYFTKHYKFQYLPFSTEYKNSCIDLYDKWAQERKKNQMDGFYCAMIIDFKTALKVLLDNYRKLDFTGGVVKIGGKIKAFTFGFRLNKDTFCILYEITDLSVKGLSQFIFKQFCADLKDYKYINIMDDSGLENLKRVKLSYKPVRQAASYIIKKI